MTNFLSVVVGILIGVILSTWPPLIAFSLAWGLLFCLGVSIASPERLEEFRKNTEIFGWSPRRRLSPQQSFYVTEYWSASLTALVFALVPQLVRILR